MFSEVKFFTIDDLVHFQFKSNWNEDGTRLYFRALGMESLNLTFSDDTYKGSSGHNVALEVVKILASNLA